MRKLIIFLIRKRLGLKKYEHFKFANQAQNNSNVYYFADEKLVKITHGVWYEPSGCSLNWLLDSECKIIKLGVKTHEKT